jgi:putative transposase
VLWLCGISRQAHFQSLQRSLKEQEKSVLYIRMMGQVREIHPGMGLRTMYDMLAPEGIGRDGFIALGLQEGFRLTTIEPQTRTAYSVKTSQYKNLLGDMEFTDISQLCSSDITYFHCLGRFYYIVFIMDVYSRRIIGHSVADNMRAENNLAALQMALKTRGVQNYDQGLVHHSDKGSQYAADNYTDLLGRHGVRISMCNEVYENTHIERVNGVIKNQYLKRKEITSVSQLGAQLNASVRAYNETQPHQSLDKMPPVKYENYILEVKMDKRKKMKIYTARPENGISANIQLNLFNG